jgi:hypothetical protein
LLGNNELTRIFEMGSHNSGDDSRNLVFDTAKSVEYCLGNLPLGRIPTQGENRMARRRFLSQLLGLPFLALGARAQESKKTLRILMRSSWGTDDPTRASFVFAHALALADAGHEVQIFLTADANYLMRKATLDAVIPIGWPPLSELREKVVAKHIPVFA